MAAESATQKPAKKPAGAKPGAGPSRRNRDAERLYKPGRLSLWFAISSGLLILSWVAMIWKDYDRPWKQYQKAFNQKTVAMARAKYDAIAADLAGRSEEIRAAKKEMDEAWQALSTGATGEKYAALQKERDDLIRDRDAADNEVKFIKGLVAPARYQYEEAKQDHDRLVNARRNGADVDDGAVESARKAMEAKRSELNKYGQRQWEAEGVFKNAYAKWRQAADAVLEISADWRAAKAGYDELVEARVKEGQTLEGLELLYSRNQWRNAPFLDFISPSLQVKQVVLDDIHDNWNFATNRKVDRCMTCHLGIANPEWSSEETIERFDVTAYMQAHSGLDLIAGPTSPHKVERFGCTVCHHGVGWSTDFSRAAHKTSDYAEKHRWEEEHGYYKAKYIDFPMLPVEHTEGQCWKCHKDGIPWPVHYDESLTHGYVTGFDPDPEVAEKDRLPRGQFVFGRDDPRFDGPENRRVPPFELYAGWQLPSAPPPFAYHAPERAWQWVYDLEDTTGVSINAKIRTKQAWQLWRLIAHYREPFARADDVDEEEITPALARWADETVHDYGWHAQVFDEGYDTVVSYGCQGCHKIQDFGQQVGYEEPPRVGPTLTYIADKVTPEFLEKWIRHPDVFRPDTKMPSFFWFAEKDHDWNFVLNEDGTLRIHNVLDAHMLDPKLAKKLGPQTTPNDIKHQTIQLLAMKAFLLNQKDEKGNAYTRLDPNVPDNRHYLEELPPGDIERGREIVHTLGCVACHVVPEIQQDGEWVEDRGERFRGDALAMQGPRLKGLGSKLKDGRWLNAWLVNPRHYTAHTRMPDMRIEDEVDPVTGEIRATAAQQRADVIAYLLDDRNETFDAIETAPFLSSYADELVDMYETFYGKDEDGDWIRRKVLEGRLGNLADEERLGTVLAQVGEKLMSRNGCFGCHEVAGHEGDQPIGTELTREGIKDLHQLDFGAVGKKIIPHTRQDFFFHKLRTPRIWDVGKEKIWQDRLRMPRFNFREPPPATHDDHADEHADEGHGDEEHADEEHADEEHADEEGGEEAGDAADEAPSEWIAPRQAVTSIVLGLVDEPLKAGILQDLDTYQRDLVEGRRIIKRYACNNCHTIEGERGLLWGHFADQGQDQATLPPNLFGQGLRTRSEWLVKFLKDPEFLRPIVNVHMPRFRMSDEEAETLARYFLRLAGRDQSLIVPRPDSKLTRLFNEPLVLEGGPDGTEIGPMSGYVEEAQLLFERINCNRCHLPKGAPGADPTDGGVAPSFEHSPERLRHAWVQALLYNPQHLIEGTKMPQVWLPQARGPGRQVDTNYLPYQFWLRDDPRWQQAYGRPDGSPEKIRALEQLAQVQIRALTDYLLWHYRPAAAGK